MKSLFLFLSRIFVGKIEQSIMNNVYRLSGKSNIYAVMGDPISHSLSPIMHNAAFDCLNLDSVYIAFHVLPENLQNAAQAIRTLNIKGVNVTIPHKKTISLLMDEVFGDSLQTGSVNTVINRNGKLMGTSTDGTGFIQSLREEGGFDPAGKKVILLGAGGSALALAFRLILSGVTSIVCFNRNLDNAENLKTMIFKSTGFQMDVKPLSCMPEIDWSAFDLLINTTSVGLSEDTSIVPKNLLTSKLFVYDIVYKKQGTRLLKEALNAGCRVLDGLSLLAYQGAESFRLWFEKEPPIKEMKTALQNYLEKT